MLASTRASWRPSQSGAAISPLLVSRSNTSSPAIPSTVITGPAASTITEPSSALYTRRGAPSSITFLHPPSRPGGPADGSLGRMDTRKRGPTSRSRAGFGVCQANLVLDANLAHQRAVDRTAPRDLVQARD